MFLELHILQNFAPANLNRDDTGSPKDCEFGGYRRARVSSQSWKRAIRQSFQDELKPGQRGFRTKRIVEECCKAMTTSFSTETDEALKASKRAAVVALALEVCELSVDDKGQNPYLLFVGQSEVKALAELCDRHAEAIWTAAEARPKKKAADKGKVSGDATLAEEPKKKKLDLKPEVVKDLKSWLSKGRGAVDVALFGRMLANIPEQNVEAASQVAHAISTNKLSAEFDYYTAVDDLKPDDTDGAGMIGTVGFNSACFYRYLNLDFEQLKRNLGGDANVAKEAAQAWATAAIHSIPTGKQNSMAAQNPPFFVLAVVRRKGLWSLANAFIEPVRPSREADLATGSVNALAAYWEQLATMYGADGLAISTSSLLDAKLTTKLGKPTSVAQLIEQSTSALVS